MAEKKWVSLMRNLFTTRTLVEISIFWVIFFFLSSPPTEQQKCTSVAIPPPEIYFGNRKEGGFGLDTSLFKGKILKQSVWDIGDRGMVSEVFVMTIDSDPPFNFVMPPPSAKEGVQLSVIADGIFEPDTHKVFRWILEGNCISNGKRNLVIDAGANLGYFSLLSASHGCRSIAVEPQPRLQAMINFAIDINPGMRERIKLHQKVVTNDLSAKLKVVYMDICWACSFAEPVQPGEIVPEDMLISPITISSLANENVLLLKIDVEGHEIRALESAHELIKNNRVENILVEWSPSRWSKVGKTLDDGVKELEYLSSLGYVVRHYDLRMTYPQAGLKMDVFPFAGRTWVIPHDKLRDLTKSVAYGEANLWFHLPDSKSSKKE